MKKFLIATLLMFSLPATAADVAIIGNSVSAPSDAGAWSPGQGYGAIVAARMGMTEVNLAASGATVVPVTGEPNMLDQFDAALARSPLPSIIIVQPGENDIFWQNDIATFKSTLNAKVAAARASGITVWLNTPFHRESGIWYRAASDYVQAIRDIAAANGCQLNDIFGLFSDLNLTDASFSTYFYTGDGIFAHPTVYGQLLIADRILGHAAIPQIPVMTAATTSGVTLTGNDLNSTGTITSAPVWMIDASPAYTIQWNQSGGGWIEAQFPSAFVPYSYSLRTRTEANAQTVAPKTRTFQGWNGSSWDDLDQVTNEPAWLQGERRTRLINTATAYSRYRVNDTASQGGTYLQYRELQISK